MLDTAREGVERADDVVAVEPQVERKVVPRPRRDADVGQVVLHGDLGYQRLRAVASGHADHVGGPGRLDGERAQIVASLQDDRFDASPARLVHEVEPLDLPASRPRVHEKHGPGWTSSAGDRLAGSRRRRCGRTGKRAPAREGVGTGGDREHDKIVESAKDDQRDRTADERRDGADGTRAPCVAASSDRDPARGTRDEESRECGQ